MFKYLDLKYWIYPSSWTDLKIWKSWYFNSYEYVEYVYSFYVGYKVILLNIYGSEIYEEITV